MVYRGCIMKVEEGFAIVLTDHAKYIKIIKKDGLAVGKEIIFVKEDIYKERRATVKNIGLIAAVFMMMILSMTGIGKFNILETMSAAAIVSVDINPSIEFKINKEKKVLHVEALNMDGKELIDREFKDMIIEEAVLVVIDNAKKKEYITKEKNAVLISTAAVKDEFKERTVELEKEIEEKIQEDQNLEDVDLIYIQGNKKDLKEAKKQKISIGKYEVYKQSKEKEQNITLDQIKNMKVQEIVDKEIGKLKEKKVKNKVKEKSALKEKKNNLEKNDSVTPKEKINKRKNISLDQIKKQEQAKKEEKKKDIQQDRENKNENIKGHKEIKKEAAKIKKEDRIEGIENKKEEKKQKIEVNQQNKREILEKRKALKKEKIEKMKEAKEEKKKALEKFKESKRVEKKSNEKNDDKIPKNKNHKKNKKD